MKQLIAYFSRSGGNYVSGQIVDLKTGNTEVAAKMLQELTGAELFKIEMTQPYSSDHMACVKQAKQDMESDARPEMAEGLKSIDEYDVIYLGYPNYWGTIPMVVRTFLEQFDFTGKTIYPFCTHEGSGMGSSEMDLKRFYPTTNVGKGLAIHGGSVQSAKPIIKKWIGVTK